MTVRGGGNSPAPRGPARGRTGRTIRSHGSIPRRLILEGMLQLMIEMAEFLERMSEGKRVAPEEARSIKERLQAIREDMLRARQEQAGDNATE